MKPTYKKQGTKPPLILKNRFSYGLIIGIILPLLSYGIIYVFDQSLISSKTVRDEKSNKKGLLPNHILYS